MKLKVPRLRKQAILPIIIGVVIILLVLGVFFHVLPNPQSLPHLLEPKTPALSAQSVAEAGTPLSAALAKPLTADFLASPGYMANPLSVQFFDQSRGDPNGWRWDFGDNSTSSDQFPVHVYSAPGDYNVTLSVSRDDGAQSTEIFPDVLDTREDTDVPVILDTIRDGIFDKGSYVSFVSQDPNSTVTVNGARTTLPVGSIVKIRANEDTTGTITLRSSNILACSFSDATMFINGTQSARGSFGDCNVPSVQSYHANLKFAVEPTFGEVRQLIVNGKKILAGPENSHIALSLDSQNPGTDLTAVAFPAYFEGSVTNVSIEPALIASFSATSSTEGEAPLNVSFMDQSAGSPVSWSWDFGDGTTSQEQNPTHEYSSPGTYAVTMTVKTADQSSTVSLSDPVIATPPRVVANFTASPLTGVAPLTVNLIDQSTGSPTSWNWTVQENWNLNFYTSSTTIAAQSNSEDPAITLTDPGTYEVWLTVANIYGSSDMLKPGYIVVTQPYNITTDDVLFRTGKPGYLEANSSMQFTVSAPPAAITINGTYYDLPKGTTVRMVADSEQQGDITIDANRILKFDFPDMDVYTNGNLLGSGRIDSIYIPSMTNFQTGLTYYFSPNSSQTYEELNGQRYLADLDNSWIAIYNLGIDERGTLSLVSSANSTYLEGADNQTVQDWILE